jgi:hypothetical protein
MESCQ